MHKILTNYQKDTKMVLFNYEGKVVAVISIPKGDGIDITNKVLLAVNDELSADGELVSSLRLSKTHVGDAYSYFTPFSVYYTIGDKLETRSFELYKVTEY